MTKLPIPIDADTGMPVADILVDGKINASDLIKHVNRVLHANRIEAEFIEYDGGNSWSAFSLDSLPGSGL